MLCGSKKAWIHVLNVEMHGTRVRRENILWLALIAEGFEGEKQRGPVFNIEWLITVESNVRIFTLGEKQIRIRKRNRAAEIFFVERKM